MGPDALGNPLWPTYLPVDEHTEPGFCALAGDNLPCADLPAYAMHATSTWRDGHFLFCKDPPELDRWAQSP